MNCGDILYDSWHTSCAANYSPKIAQELISYLVLSLFKVFAASFILPEPGIHLHKANRIGNFFICNCTLFLGGFSFSLPHHIFQVSNLSWLKELEFAREVKICLALKRVQGWLSSRYSAVITRAAISFIFTKSCSKLHDVRLTGQSTWLAVAAEQFQYGHLTYESSRMKMH